MNGIADMEADVLSLGGITALPAMQEPHGPFPAQPEVTRASAASTERPLPKVETPTTEDVIKTARELGEALTHLNHGIHYEVDHSTDRVITKIIDRETKEVIRQIPPEEMMKMSHRLKKYVGVLLDIGV